MNAYLEASILAWASSVVAEEVSPITKVRSHEVNEVFRLTAGSKSLFLKVGPSLQREYQRLQWLEGRLRAPRPVGFTSQFGNDAFLMSAIEGVDLAQLSASLAPKVVIPRLATALKAVHATDFIDWPFERTDRGTVLVHGDACLPNFLYLGDQFTGYIDLGDMRVDDPEVDLAAAVWSLQYNLGPGHGLAFLREYDLPHANEDDVDRLRRMYEVG